MTFLNPLLLFGLAGVAVPIVVHLLNRHRPRLLEFGAMKLLRRAMVTRSRQVKLEDWLLLALRCLAVLLLALAMTRPTLTTATARLGGAGQTAVVIGLDVSMSMAHQPGVYSRFDRALEQVRTILASLEPGAPVSLVELGAAPRVLHEGRYDPQQLELTLVALEPRPERLNLERSLEVLADQLQTTEAASRELYLVTDVQAEDFADPSPDAQARLTELTQRMTVILVPVGDDRHENLMVEALTFVGGALRVGATARLHATVHNTGNTVRHDVAVQLLHDDTPVTSTLLPSVEPGQTVTASFLMPWREAGWHRLTARLEPDQLNLDNQAFAVVHVREQTRILVVSGRPAHDAREMRDAGGFIVRALRPRPMLGQTTGLTVDVVDWLELGLAPLENVDMVVLEDVPDVAEAQVRQLRRFVEGGGGVVLLLGEQVEPQLFNARLASGEAPLSPARLGAVRELTDTSDTDGDTAGGLPLHIAIPTHVLTRPLQSLSADLLDEARLHRVVSAEPLAGAQVVLSVAKSDGEPLLIERKVGQGTVLLLTSAADRRWGDWMIHPAWPILWQQIVSTLTQPSIEPVRVGQTLTVVLAEGFDPQTQVRFVGPREHETVLAPRHENGRSTAVLPRTEWSGFYELRLEEGDGSDPLAWQIVRPVNADPRESRIRTLNSEALLMAWPGLPAVVVSESLPLAEAIRRVRLGMELWRPLLWIALAVLVIEAMLARYFSRRMAATSSASPRPLHAARWSGHSLTPRQGA